MILCFILSVGYNPYFSVFNWRWWDGFILNLITISVVWVPFSSLTLCFIIFFLFEIQIQPNNWTKYGRHALRIKNTRLKIKSIPSHYIRWHLIFPVFRYFVFLTLSLTELLRLTHKGTLFAIEITEIMGERERKRKLLEEVKYPKQQRGEKKKEI